MCSISNEILSVLGEKEGLGFWTLESIRPVGLESLPENITSKRKQAPIEKTQLQ